MPTTEEVTAEAQAMINKALVQRNIYADEVMQLHGALALKDLHIAQLMAKVEELTPKPTEDSQ